MDVELTNELLYLTVYIFSDGKGQTNLQYDKARGNS